MRLPAGAKRSPALRLALILGCPLLILLGGELSARSVRHRQNPDVVRADLEARARDLESFFETLLRDAVDAARIALERSPSSVSSERRNERLASRLEGAGILDSNGTYLEWDGTPSDPRSPTGGGAISTWSIRRQGFWTRLVTATTPGAGGRIGSASFLLDSPLPEQGFLSLLPAALTRGVSIRVEFEDTEATESRRAEESASPLLTPPPGARARWTVFEGGPPATLRMTLATPSRETLAWVTFEEISPGHRAALRRGEAFALASLVLVLLTAVLVDWGSWCRSLAGLAVTLFAIAGGRALLLAARAAARLLPRELGSPIVYGSSASFGLLGSPADLFLTALAFLLAVMAYRAYSRRTASGHLATVAVIGGASAFAATAWLTVVSLALARDAQVPVLSLDGLTRSWGRVTLLASLLMTLLGTAEVWATLWTTLRRSRGGSTSLEYRGLVAVVLLPLAAWSSVSIQTMSDYLALDRLHSEYAPLVLEQASRRRVALQAAVRAAAQLERARDAVRPPAEAEDLYAGYRVWVAGDLFHAGFSSSIDIYDASGVVRSHFGFDLPRLNEPPPKPQDGADLGLREEEFPVGAQRQRVVHAESPIIDRGLRVGTVVGHVLDEPEDLPFLPKIAPYLSALGPGAPLAADDTYTAVGYVLYDESGRVLASTLNQPPASTHELRQAADRGETTTVRAGEERFVAVPLKSEGRLHLLLLPLRTPLERLGALVRLFLLGLAFLALEALLDYGFEPRGIASLVQTIRGSFYRKLLAALLLASVVPVVGLALFLRGYLERRSEETLVAAASGVVRTAQRVVEDYAAVAGEEDPAGGPPEINDEILSWLRRVVDQEILLYENGTIAATSRPELFSSGLLPGRLPGEVQSRVALGGTPFLVLTRNLGPTPIPVAYARANLPRVRRETVVAVPLVLQQREVALGVARVGEMLLLASVLLGGLVAAAGALLARTVARPVRELVRATGRIAAGDYGTRIRARTRDEVAELVDAFNAMGTALAEQRTDLERRRDYMEALLRHASAGVVSTDAAGSIVTLNPAAADLLASPAGAPRVGEELVEAVGRNPELTPLAQALARPPGPGAEPEEIDLQVRGRPRRLRLVRAALPDPFGGPPGTLALLDDVTELMRSNQLAAWAEMARAIAHEIKNPLTPIQLSAEHLERLLRDRGVLPSRELEACLETVVKQVRSLREIASEFSAYAKLPTLSPEPIDPAELVRETVAPYKAAHPPGVSIEERYEATPAVPVDKRVMTRALVNLVENALHAMPSGGVLSLGVAPDRGGSGAVLSVGDTGPGLDAAVRARLFEPYFSTKSSGTGLGLAIVRRAVEAHGGRIEVESGRGNGTVFRIHLPSAAA